tara:strand:- start:1231 stop:1623 length:393 start_codon:yes stop_codon:yes gene_type:complete
MTALSNYSELKILDLLFKNTTFTAPNAYLGLFTAAPNDAGGGTEVSGNDYARVQIDTKMASAASGAISSNADITFPTANGGAFGTVTHIGIFDAASSGNLLAHGALSASRVISDGDTFQINSGSLTVTID